MNHRLDREGCWWLWLCSVRPWWLNPGSFLWGVTEWPWIFLHAQRRSEEFRFTLKDLLFYFLVWISAFVETFVFYNFPPQTAYCAIPSDHLLLSSVDNNRGIYDLLIKKHVRDNTSPQDVYHMMAGNSSWGKRKPNTSSSSKCLLALQPRWNHYK